MTIIDFYKKLSVILEDRQVNRKSEAESKELLDDLLLDAKCSNLDVSIDPNILTHESLIRLDDERSYEDYDSSYESSF
jgi:hypothetical protein